MNLAKFSVFNIYVELKVHEMTTKTPVYAITYARGIKENRTYKHFSISYTRRQAFKIYRRIILHLTEQYLHLIYNNKNYAKTTEQK